MSRNRRSLLSSASRRSTSIFEPLEDRRLFAAGSLDPSFSGDGRATVDFGPGITTVAEAVVVQGDGKTVVAGTTSDHQIAVARFNPDGTLDSSFGPKHDGKVLTKFAGAKVEARAQSVLIDSANRILVGGYYDSDGSGFTDALIARYLPNGALDPAFGNGSSHQGVTITDFGGDPVATVEDMAIAPGGRIIVVGHGEKDTITNINTDMMVACLKDNGYTDSSFGDGGHQFLGFGDFEGAEALAIDNTGSSLTNPNFGTIVVVGEEHDNSQLFQGPRKFAIARLRANGSLDSSFDKDGKMLLSIPGQASVIATGVVIQPSGKIVISGQVEQTLHGKQRDFGLIRLLSDGSLDATFGGNNTGINITNVKGDDVANDMIQMPDGGLLVGGNAGGKFAIVKYTADGVVDKSFGTSGIVATDNGGVSNLARGPGRRFVATGGAPAQVNRYLDTGANLVYATTFLDPAAKESTDAANPDQASFFVFRSERLPVKTRVYLNVSGTATSPLLKTAQTDYTGITASLAASLPVFTIAGGTQAFNAAGALGAVTAPNAVTISKLPVSKVIGPGPTTIAYVDILPNDTFAQVTITALDDNIFEGDETAIFSVRSDSAYEVGTPSDVTITIRDNDGVVLADVADAYVRDGASANTNFGSASDLQVKNNAAGTQRQTFIKFDLTNVSLSSIGNVTLKLFGNLNNTNQQNVATSVFGSNDVGWSENAITFNAKPAVTTGELAKTTIIDSTPRFYTWDITAYVKSEKALGHNQITLVLKNNGTSDPFATFASKESGVNAPQLGIAFV